ncbi:unnamed protein product [Mesocestoides corti]|uniref:Rho-related GTP-binding protein RhoU n=1 Tax=Mesocestoides corti TaxID=53468 RepID=A0A0R3UGM6_MESCO|nr:unnamed protein product [Mesocestoides corti]
MSVVQENQVFTIKCVVVGDERVGKSCLIARLSGKPVDNEYRQTMVDMSTVRTFLGKTLTLVDFWDTPGAHNFQSIRLLAYQDTHIFAICFSVVVPESFSNVRKKWIPELKMYGPPNARFVLIGLQSDLRGDEAVNQSLHQMGLESPTIDQGAELAQTIGAIGYFECSSVTQTGVEAVLQGIKTSIANPLRIARHASVSFSSHADVEGVEELRKSLKALQRSSGP